MDTYPLARMKVNKRVITHIEKIVYLESKLFLCSLILVETRIFKERIFLLYRIRKGYDNYYDIEMCESLSNRIELNQVRF